MKVVSVTGEKDWKVFHRVPHRIYRNDPNWIAPPESDVRGIFSPDKNKAFDQGAARLFYLLDEAGKPAGRIAAFLDHGRNAQLKFPIGGVGFFECVDRADYADALFQKAEDWLAAEGVKAIDGPINFGERERYWGLLEKGFDPPLFQENYHPRYYKAFFTNRGYQPFEQVLTFKGTSRESNVERFRRIARLSAKRYGLHAEHFDLKNIDRMAAEFCTVYNRAFAEKEHFKPLTVDQMRNLFKEFLPIADEEATSMAYHDDRPVALCVFLPDINPFLRFARGKLNWWTLPIFMLRFRLARTKAIKGIAFGVDPDYHGRGAFPVVIAKMMKDHFFAKYPTFYMAGIRSYNKIMVDSILNLQVKIDRVHVAYRKMLDPKVAFEPHEFMEV